MSNDEIKKILKNNDENNYQLGISSNLAAIRTILLKNKLTTEEEFNKIREYALEKILEQQIENMTEEEKRQIEAMKKFNDLFGNAF